MKKVVNSLVVLLTAVTSLAAANSMQVGGLPATPSADLSAPVYFTADGQTYAGTYSTKDKGIAVNIDGLTYKGQYTALAEDSASASSGASSGRWGRAFLFASSARNLQCKLDAGFPQMVGQCKAADGQVYQLHTARSKAATSPAVPPSPASREYISTEK